MGQGLFPEGLRAFPETWEVRKFKYCSRLQMERNGLRSDRPMLSVSQYRGVVIREYEEEYQKRTAKELENYLVVRPKQLVLNTMWLNYRGLGVSAHEGTVSPAYRVYDLTGRLTPRFTHYLLRCDAYIGLYSRLAYGVRPNSLQVSTQDFGEILVPIPDLHQQRAIADFLDRKTAAIDALIEKKERLIALLQEKRQALITQAVTKGLDPNVPMKDSGIEWLGEIPAHWDLHQLRRVVTTFVDYRGRTPTKSADGVPLITAGAIRNGVIDHSRVPEYMPEEDYVDWMRRGTPHPGDLVITTEAPLGEVAIVEDTRVAFAQRVILFKVNHERMTSRFLWLYYQSVAGRGELLSRASGSTASGIRADRLRGSLVVTPPLQEQESIVDAVESELASHWGILRKLHRNVDLLREYRQAVITAAVTGKLDVNSEAA